MLEAKNLHKWYGDFHALKGVSFSISRGEVLGIIGENGAGKSTTIKILVSLIKPNKGDVMYDGESIFQNPKIRKKIGYVPEVDAMYENVTAKEYLEFFASLYRVKNKKNKIKKLMSKLKIPDKMVGDFSKGMRRKLSIARSLIHDPEYLIYDEPIGGLDPSTSMFIADFIKNLKDKVILFSAHNLFYIEYVCECVAIMKDGRIIYLGSMNDIKRKEYIVKYRVDSRVLEKRIESVDELKDMLKDGIEILDIDVSVKRLEELYFELMNLRRKAE